MEADMKNNKPSEDPIVLRNEYLSITLGIEGGRLCLNSIKDSSGHEFLGDAQDNTSIWQIVFRGPSGESKEVESSKASFLGQQMNKFKWIVPLGEVQAEVHMSVRLNDRSRLSYWSISAKLPNGWKINRANFPIIPNIKPEKGLKMAAPFGWGLEYELKPGEAYDATYREG